MRWSKGALCFVFLILLAGAACAQEELAAQARAALRKATLYFTTKVATHGGYLWRYTSDLTQRWGEGEATATQIWVQPPGTPSVGMAFLRAYEVTGDQLYLEAAKDAAAALCWGQLSSGGWHYKIDFDPEKSKRRHYRRDVEAGDTDPRGRWHISTFDDDTSQSALRLVMSVDQATGGAQPFRNAAEYGLKFMLKSQFENGAWPQCYPPVEGNYCRYYTFNDGAINDCIKTMLLAYKIYRRREYLESALRGGRFIIASQLPAPQAGWAQQYDWDMKPAWARWFEPPACCSAVTARNIRTLVDLYLETGDEKFLQPIPAAIDWLGRSKIDGGTWARFYELGTNKPIYVTVDKKVVYEFKNIRPHYGWRGDFGVPSSIRYYEAVRKVGREAYLAQRDRVPTPQEWRRKAARLAGAVRKIIAALDEQGRWLDGEYINTSTFVQNVSRLCDYLEAVRKSEAAGGA